VAINTVVGNIEFAALKPIRVGLRKLSAGDFLPGLMPVQQISSLFGPEVLGASME